MASLTKDNEADILKRLSSLEKQSKKTAEQVKFLTKELFRFRAEPYDQSNFEHPPITNSSPWVLLVRQNCQAGGYFKPNQYSCNVNHPEAPLYSNLEINYDNYRGTIHTDALNSFVPRNNGTDNDNENKNEETKSNDNDNNNNNDQQMVFLLLWPNIHLKNSSYVPQGMIWIQESTPIENNLGATSGKHEVRGYKPILVPYPGNKAGYTFNGIHKSTRRAGNCNFNGMSNGNDWWWYTVSSITPYGGGIPGPLNCNESIVVDNVEFYILDIKHSKLKYAMYILSNCNVNEIGFDIATIIAEYSFDKREIVRQSLHLIYPF